MFVFFVLCISACTVNDKNTSTYSERSMDWYLEKAAEKADPIKALKNVYKELSILKLNQPNLSAIHYDTCLTADLIDHIDQQETLKVNVLNLKYLNNFMTGDTENEEAEDWSFLHSRSFDYLVPLAELKENDQKKAVTALAHWYNIQDIRYTVVLYEQNKILPRTKFDNYVLGGYFQGNGILYDLKEHKVLCYFNFRINNLSNKIEDYTKEGQSTYEVMLEELTAEMKNKIQFEVSRKLNIEEDRIEPGL